MQRGWIAQKYGEEINITQQQALHMTGASPVTEACDTDSC